MKTLERIHWIVAALLVLAMALTGCASAPNRGRPYTPSERRALGHAILGQSLDMMTTSMALTSDRMQEGNPIYWGDDAEAIIVGKLVMMGGAYLVGEAWPDSRKTMWWIIAGGGYIPATWNTYQMIEHDVNPWRD
jgi:hypothetical protein